MTLYTHRRQRGPRLWAFAVAAAALLLLASSSAPVSAAPPTLNASPNPVIIPFGMSTGGTTLSWSLNGAPFGQLLVQESGGPVLLDTAVKTPSGSAPLTVT